jgi:hypothetical protein
MLVAFAACSEPEGAAQESAATEVDTGSFDQLFAAGFGETANAPMAAAGAEDPRAGIPYSSSSSRRGRVEAALADNLASNFSIRFAIADPARFVRSGKASEVYKRELEARGLPRDTVAGATALMFGVAWEITNGKKLSPDENAAILRQATTLLRGNPLERQGDKERQEAAELRLITAGLWLEEAYVRAPFPEQMRELSDAVHGDMKKISNTDLRSKVVTAEGFVDR